jgi:nitrate reductase NapE component
MAVLCAKCSAEVPAGSQFCAACGTPIAAAAAPAYTSPAPPPAYTPVAPEAAAPAKSGSSAVKIILIVLAIVVCLGVLGAGAFGFMVWRISRSIHVAGANGAVTLNTPGGTIEANSAKSFTPGELGTDIYPGAQSTSGGMKMELPSGSVVSGAFLTSDSKDAVLNFYKGKFGSDASVFDTADGAMLSVKKGEQESVMVTISSKAGENDGKTKFVIVHTKNNKAS